MPTIYNVFEPSGQVKLVQMVIANCRSPIHAMSMSLNIRTCGCLPFIVMRMTVINGCFTSKCMRMHSHRHKKSPLRDYFMEKAFYVCQVVGSKHIAKNVLRGVRHRKIAIHFEKAPE